MKKTLIVCTALLISLIVNAQSTTGLSEINKEDLIKNCKNTNVS